MQNQSQLLETLNAQQQEAVTAPDGNILVLAGAGSGKTRVLVHRVAWLVYEKGYSPQSIMAVTFTNKAAGELKNRIEELIGTPMYGMWVGTFHGLAHKLLRLHWQEAGLAQHFQVLDSEDQKRLIKRLMKDMNLDESQWQPREAQWYINKRKDDGLRAKQIKNVSDYYNKTMLRIYEAYEKVCQQSDLVDFAELLLRALELWRDNPSLLEHYNRRFRAILVDEFQDTNTVQYAWLKQISTPDNHIMIVGDDDQSIYGWRGAKIENIQKFSKDFASAQTIRLEQNYRSTKTILKAANKLISHNDDRMGKDLWSVGEEGAPIGLYAAFNEIDEAKFVAEKIAEWTAKGNMRSDIGVLYRSNAQSRVIEESLIHAGIPYRVYGGLRFFERAEIKDALGYLRLIANKKDDAAFERIINQPNRGIGERTLARIREFAKAHACSSWEAVLMAKENKLLTARAQTALQAFIELLEKLSQDREILSLEELTKKIIKISGLWDYYSGKKGEKSRAKVENLEELVSAAKIFSLESENDSLLLNEFLAHAVLEAGETQGVDPQECVQLMTLHSAKGLEFPLVFLTGIEEGVFPHQLSLSEPGRLEEERRLCYVGMTRAKQQLYITYAEVRREFGKDTYHKISRFIKEMDSTCLTEIRSNFQIRKPISLGKVPSDLEEMTGFKLGQRVSHQKFGKGMLVDFEGTDDSARVQVKFDRVGNKWLVLSYAKLMECN